MDMTEALQAPTLDAKPNTTASAASVFTHKQSAHCESGVVAAMLRAKGMQVSEAMVFGAASALCFAYLPFVKINGLPLISYRMPPRYIINSLRRKLNVPFRFETFSSSQQGERRLDELLAQGHLVGVQSSVYFLPYFPVNMRFHFNAHNLMVYGKEGNEYLVSDPVFPEATRCAVADMTKARFVKGALAPKGLLYYIDGEVPPIDWKTVLPGSLRKSCIIMAQRLFPLFGARGLRTLADKLGGMQGKQPEQFLRRYVGHIVRMQEEIGTGGAGFRYLYAAFLQEAAGALQNPHLENAATELTAIGDAWREFALSAARMNKARLPLDLPHLQGQLRALAERESRVFAGIKQCYPRKLFRGVQQVIR